MSKQFVFHHHTGYGEPHYDLMLHHGEALATWQLTIPLSQIPDDQEIIVRKIQDHRLIYLTYQGAISGGRGEIKRLERGDFEPLIIEASYWYFILNGQQLKTHYELSKINSENETWSLRKFQR